MLQGSLLPKSTLPPSLPPSFPPYLPTYLPTIHPVPHFLSFSLPFIHLSVLSFALLHITATMCFCYEHHFNRLLSVSLTFILFVFFIPDSLCLSFLRRHSRIFPRTHAPEIQTEHDHIERKKKIPPFSPQNL